MSEHESDKTAREASEKNYAVKGNDLSGFRGVSPEYMTYASETEKPVAKKDDKKGNKKKDEPKQESPKAPQPAPSAPSAPSGQRQS